MCENASHSAPSAQLARWRLGYARLVACGITELRIARIRRFAFKSDRMTVAMRFYPLAQYPGLMNQTSRNMCFATVA